MKKFFWIILTLGLLTGCGSVTEGFKLKKGNTGDEFLVEKKNPLVLPPEFSELPQPGNTNISNEKEEDLIKVLTSQNYIINFFKYSINRRRPYQIDKNLNPLSTKTSRTPAYPAGHAYQALLLAKYLTDKYPEKRELFNKIALRCDDCRVTAGIHYKSDGEFSRKLFKFFNL